MSGDDRLKWKQTRAAWTSEPSIGVTDHEYDLGVLEQEFVNNVLLLAEHLSGTIDRSKDVHTALSYFGYELSQDSVMDASYDDRSVRGRAIRSFSGMRAQPEWADIDRENLGRAIADLTQALRDLVIKLKADNYSDDSGMMSGVEKRQLLVALEAASLELKEAPKVNKSALRGISAWCLKLSSEVGYKYLSSELSVALDGVGHQILELLKRLPLGQMRLPW